MWCAWRPRSAVGQSGPLRWGGDAEGGAPFVEADPSDPTRLVGFDVEIAQILADGLGRPARFVQVGFTSLEASAVRGDFDIGLSGVEDTPARRARLAVTIPYYEFREVLTVRKPDGDRYRSLADLRGRRVATLGATLAYDILPKAEADYGVVPVTYEDDVHPYSDLALGRVDAVLLDQVLARAWRPPQPVADQQQRSRRGGSLRRYPGSGESGAARSARRDPSCRDARWPPGGDLPPVGRLERRSGALYARLTQPEGTETAGRGAPLASAARHPRRQVPHRQRIAGPRRGATRRR